MRRSERRYISHLKVDGGAGKLFWELRELVAANGNICEVCTELDQMN